MIIDAKEMRHEHGAAPRSLIVGHAHEWIKYTSEWEASKGCVGMRLQINDDLKELISIVYTNKMHLLLNNPSLKNSTKHELDNFGMGDLLGSFLGSMWVRSNHHGVLC